MGAVAARRTNLPSALTSFVGRGAELATVKRLITDSRLVTLTGVGGIGKTRLALEAAAQVLVDFTDGVWWVELAPVSDAEFVAEVVLGALGLGPQSGRPSTASLALALAGKEMLLVLDNCEHVIEGCARLAETLLMECARLRILATSRELLGLTGEKAWRVPSMPTPDADRSIVVDELQRVEIVQLLVQRVDAARPGFRLTEETAPAAARICARLDGIPLAVELAAARTRTMSLSEIDGHLDDRFQFLTSGSRTALPRQRTLEATLDWSHDLLTDSERRLFRRLSVFRGGFTLDSARVVSASRGGAGEERAFVTTLSGLVDKSLVIRVEAAAESTRYTMLETIREYAAARSKLAGEAKLTHGRHAAWFCRLGDEVQRGLRSSHQGDWFARIDEDLDNLRACLEWTLQHSPRRTLQLAVALERYWIANNRGDGRYWLDRALDASSGRDDLRASGLFVASLLATFQGDIDEGWRRGSECLALARELGSDLFIGQACSALAIAKGLGRTGEWQSELRRLLEEGEPHIRAANNVSALQRFLNNRAFQLHIAGWSAEARPIAEEALTLSRTLGDAFALHITAATVAEIAFALGDTQIAVERWREILTVAAEIHSHYGAQEALFNLANVELQAGEPLRCLRLLAGATELQKRMSVFDANVSPQSQELRNQARAAAEQQVGGERADAAWREGSAMSFDELIRAGLGERIATRRPDAAPVVVADPEPGDSRNVFMREGDFWTLGFEGAVVRLKDSKGLQDIARLLAVPQHEVAAVDLAAGGSAAAGRSRAASRDAGDGFAVEADAGPMVDMAARQQYRERLAELEEEINDAEASNDPERATRARDERSFLIAELRAAVGFGGRERRVLDPGERARKAVTGRIRDAIGHIETAHPAMGHHLRRSVRTGTFCVYEPPAPTRWEL